MLILLYAVLGLALLVGGAEFMVRGASRIASRLGVSSLIIGLTVVAYGTSAPELVVSLRSSLTGSADIALGNVVGSNIANILLILGATGVLRSLIVDRQLIRQEVPIMIAVSVLVFLGALDGRIERWEGALLAAAAIGYTLFTVQMARKARAILTDAQKQEREAGSITKPILLALIGLIALVSGGYLLVESATGIAASMGIPELVIGLTVVAVGTSLPELATSLVAVWRGERDLAVGNVVGSNLFNMTFVLGACALTAPVVVPASALQFDLPIMIAAAIACLPVFLTGHRVDRWEAGAFLLLYGAYVMLLVVLASRGEPAGWVVSLYITVPLIVLTLVAAMIHWRALATR